MGLRSLAASDCKAILENDTTGFGWPITLTDPAGSSVVLKGRAGDISFSIDPDTGQAVSGRTASISLSIESVIEAFPSSGLPKSIAGVSSDPWVVEFDDINGAPHTFKVIESSPDRTLGLITLFLGLLE